jgi:hypothetical protein
VGHPSNVVPFTKHHARAATNVRRSPIPVCRLMLRVPLGTAAANSEIEAGALGCCVVSVVPGAPSTATRSGLPMSGGPAHPLAMGTKSRETIYCASIRAAAERTTEARKEADRLAVAAWNKRMLGFQGPAQPSPTLGDAINARYRYLEVKCLGCNNHQTVALDIVRRSKETPIHELERYMRCRQCSEVRGHAYKRSHLVALRPTKISAGDPPSTWWPGERSPAPAV